MNDAILLSRRDLQALMSPAEYLKAVEAGFLALAQGRAEAPGPMHLHGQGGAFHAKGAAIDTGSGRRVAIKLNGNFPSNRELRGRPTIQGVILLCDGEAGQVLSVMDSIEITCGRTAAASALAARFLARPESSTLTVCGCGDQALPQARALAAVLPIRRLLAWDIDPFRAEAFARTAAIELKLETAALELEVAARAADVIVTCTTSKAPFLRIAHVRPGTFVAAVGADSPSKCELDPDLLASATVVTDSTVQCAVMGDLHWALAEQAMTLDDVHAELAELVAGSKPGRTCADEVTVFDSTGLGVQDVVSAARAYELATSAGIGLGFEF